MPHIKVKFCSTNYYSLKLLLQPFKFTNKIIHCAIVTHQYSTFKDIQTHYCNHAHITGFCPITTCFKQKFLHNFHKCICPRQAFPSIFKTDSEKWSAMSNLHLKKRKNRIFSACIDFLHRVKTILCIHKSTESKNNLNLILWAMDKRCYDCRQKPKQSKSI